MTNEDLKQYYKRLLEAAEAEPGVGMQVPLTPGPAAEAPPAEPPAGQAPPADQAAMQPRDPNAQMGLSFAPNPHRFKFQPGDEVAFFDETGNMITGTISGSQVSNRFNVVDANNTSHNIMKNELFFAPGQTMADQASDSKSSA